jgi:hypothetical protein
LAAWLRYLDTNLPPPMWSFTPGRRYGLSLGVSYRPLIDTCLIVLEMECAVVAAGLDPTLMELPALRYERYLVAPPKPRFAHISGVDKTQRNPAEALFELLSSSSYAVLILSSTHSLKLPCSSGTSLLLL